MNDEAVMGEIGVAKNGVAAAQSDLARVLKEMQVAPRAEKTTIGEALDSALKKLGKARERLRRLEAPTRSVNG